MGIRVDALGRSHRRRLPLSSMLHSQAWGSLLDSAGGLSGEMRLPMVLSPLRCAGVWGKSPHAISTRYWKGAGETLLEFSSHPDKHHHLKAVWLAICTRWLCILADHLLEKTD